MPFSVRFVAFAGSLGLFLAVFVWSLPPRAVSASADQKRLGAALFHEKGCDHCHGADARGSDRGPDLSTIGKRWKKPQIEHQIHDGGGGMPAFGEALQPDEITALVEFLHGKRKAPKQGKVAPATQPAAAPSIAGEPAHKTNLNGI